MKPTRVVRGARGRLDAPMASAVMSTIALALAFGPNLWGSAAEQEAAVSSPDALNLYADAAGLQNKGAFQPAADDWEKFLRQFPNDPLADKARHYAGVCHMQLKRFDLAAKRFGEVVSKGKQSEHVEEAYLNLGWCQYSLGGQGQTPMYAKAAETLASLLRLFPKSKYADQALFYRGESLYAQGKKQEAARVYRAVVDQYPSSTLRSDVLYALGVSHEESKQHAEAGEVYDVYLKEFASNDLATEVRMRKAETVLQLGRIAEARGLFGEVAAVVGFAEADRALYRQAYCAAKQEDFAAASELFAKLTRDFPESSYAGEATLSAGRCAYRGGRHDEAARWLQRVVDSSGAGATEAAHWLCRIYLTKNQAAKAAELAERALARAEGDFLVNLKMDQADALNSLADWRADSIEKYAAIAAQYPRHELAPQALYNAAFACWELKRYADALKYADRFQSRFASHELAADVKYVVAECQVKLDRLASAESIYRELIADHGERENIGQWQLRLGLLLYLQKKYGETVRFIAKILPRLKKADEIAEAGFLLGVSYFHQDQFADAEKAFSASLAANPRWRQADETLLYLSRAQQKLNNVQDAKATARRLIAEFPESLLLDQAYYRLGEYCYADKDFAAATTTYESLLSKWPASALVPFALYGKGWAELKGQQYQSAESSFSKLIADHATHQLASDARFARAVCYRQMGRFPLAVDDLNAYLESKSTTTSAADALYERGLAEVAMGDMASAVKSFDLLLKRHADHPNAANALYELAWAKRKLEKLDESLAAFARLANEYRQSPLAAEALWRVGEHYFDKGEFEKAAETYQQAKTNASRGEIQELAIHQLGWSLFRLGKFEEALKQFREQADGYPQGKLHSDAIFMQGECLFKTRKFEEALTAFSAASQLSPSKPQMAVLTLLHAGQSASELGKWQECVRFLDQIPAKSPDPYYLAEALVERGRAKQSLNRIDEALQDYEQAATMSRGEAGARARFFIGEIQYQRKEFDQAISTFQRVMYTYGGENAAGEVKHWQAMAGFEAGRCAEVQIDLARDSQARGQYLADARKFYSFVVDGHPKHEFAPQARRRLDALAKLSLSSGKRQGTR